MRGFGVAILLSMLLGAVILAADESGPAAAGTESAGPPSRKLPWATIRGVVVDGWGKPVGGAKVWTMSLIHAGPSLEWAEISTTSRDDGTFVLPGEGRKSQAQFDSIIGAVMASTPDCERQGAAQIFRLDGTEMEVSTRIVLRPSREIRIRVVNSSNQPVAKAEVAISCQAGRARGRPFLRTQTGEDGTATVRLAPDARIERVAARKPGVGLDYFENFSYIFSLIRPPLPAEITLVLEGPRTVRIHCMDTHGKPCSGARIRSPAFWKSGRRFYLDSMELSSLPVSGEDGLITLDWLPPNCSREITLDVAAGKRYAVVELPGSGDMTSDVQAILKFPTARARGAVKVNGRLLLPDGTPGANIKMSAYGRGPQAPYESGGETTSAEDGSYSLELQSNMGYVITVIDNSWAGRKEIAVRPNQPLDNMDFRLTAGALIHGRITAGAENTLLEGIEVKLDYQGGVLPHGMTGGMLRSTNQSFQFRTTTDHDGCYHFRVGPGTYMLWNPLPCAIDSYTLISVVAGSGFVSGSSEPFPPASVSVVEGQEFVRDFHHPYYPLAMQVEGTVTAQGKPVANAVVRAYSDDAGRDFQRETWTDAGGRFSMKAPSVPLAIHALSPDGKLAEITLLRPEDVSGVRLQLEPAATLTGRVVDQHGKPVPNVLVDLWLMKPEQPDTPRSPSVDFRCATDKDGRFVIQGVPLKEKCKLYVQPDLGWQWLTRDFTVDEAATMELPDFTVPQD